ncbi:MAG: type 4a pilus biogenesis protein PilO [Candidatus Pacebacteria bacterium]|nr:type 4a pilus biogenesis protein PilO [Candidatus Paceibacterota bacterium]
MKRIFAIPVLALASFVVFLYAVLPQVSAVNRAKENFLKTEKQVNDRQKYFQDLKSSLEEISAYQDTIEKIESALPGEVFLASLIEFFNQKANNSGLILKSLAPTAGPTGYEEGNSDPIQQAKNYPAQYFIMTLNGNASSFESFLKDIETSARLVDVESISLQQQGSKEISSDINILVKVYY